ncbi:MAG: DUF4252 domain-containing protein [Acidobacteriota bacterium]
MRKLRGVISNSILAVALIVSVPLVASAQPSRLILDFPDLSGKASETVDVALDGSMLRLAAGFLSSKDADEVRIRELVRDLKGIYVKNYSFDKEGQYDPADVQRVRAQLTGTWQKIVNVKSRNRAGTSEDVEIYLQNVNGRIEGMTIIASEPKELTLVNIVGPIDLQKLSALEGQFGIPEGLSGDAPRKDGSQ